MKELKKLHNLIKARHEAERVIGKLDPKAKRQLNLKLDIEHAYYSSVLEGSQLDRKTFDDLAKSAS